MKTNNPVPLTEMELAKIMMACGALHDLAEVAWDENITSRLALEQRLKSIANQLDLIRKILENIIVPEEK